MRRYPCRRLSGLFLLLSLTLLRGGEETENPLGNGLEIVAEGRKLYNSSCTVCHGFDGAEGDRGPALAAGRRYARNTEHEIFDAIMKGIAGTEMPPSGLAAEEAWKVVAYVRSLRAVAAEVQVSGDPDKGSEIFWSDSKGRCGTCHRVRGRGGFLGPDLSNLGGEMSLARIREALTASKPHAPRGYRPVNVVTQDGRTISGVARNEHNFSIQVLDSAGRLHLLSMDEIRELRREDRSLMPTDYGERLSGQEFQDLLAFLSRLSVGETQSSKGGAGPDL